MALIDDLQVEVAKFFSEQWSTREGQKVPDSSGLKMANDALTLDATVLYADMAASTHLVDNFNPHFAAEIYKAYLHCTAKIIRSMGGVITSYDGDRIMAVFIGDTKNTSAVKAGLKINYTTKNIVNPAIKAQYNTEFQAAQTVGIDTSQLFVAKTGIRGSNDLVWVGRAANYAAKLTDLSSDYPTWITHNVFNKIHKSAKFSSNGTPMWDARIWKTMNDMSIYRSNWSRKI
jgi:class 3 adenylate cyclase